MARTYALISTLFVAEEGFRKLSTGAQWLYYTLRLQPDLNMAGTLPLTQMRWARLAGDAEVDEINRALDELSQAGFILTDFCTQEVGIRGIIGSGPRGTNTNWCRAAIRALATVRSPYLVRGLIEGLPAALAEALSRARDALADTTPDALADALADALPDCTPDVLVSVRVKKHHQQRAQQRSAEAAISEDESTGTSDWLATAAAAVLADRDLRTAQTRARINDVPAYYRKCLDGRLLRDGQVLASVAGEHPDWTPEHLADFVDRPRLAGRQEYIPEGTGQGIGFDHGERPAP